MAGSRDSGCGEGEDRRRCGAVLHPLRRGILRLLSNGRELGVEEIAAELEQPPARIAAHVRVLVGRGALKIEPRAKPNRPRYRWSPDADWARKLLDEIDQGDAAGD
jgi:DNA-binding transcriptional ArsR family regulator